MVDVKRANRTTTTTKKLVGNRIWLRLDTAEKKLMENFKTHRQTKREKMNQFHEPNTFVVLRLSLSPRAGGSWRAVNMATLSMHFILVGSE